MNKRIVIIPIIIVITIVIINFPLDSSDKENNDIFHVTLADPNLYIDGIYTDKFLISEGDYYFGFVPNGSSPKILSITIQGENIEFSEDFERESTLHKTGISEYYTWDYKGERNISISEGEEITITINPNGNVMGSVSVDILQN